MIFLKIKDYCRKIEKGHDCLEYAHILKKRFPSGEILCIKKADGSDIFVVNFDEKGLGEDYSCHCVFVYEGRVYDVLHDNLDIDFDEYIDILGKMNKGKLAANKRLSTYSFGLPVYKHV